MVVEAWQGYMDDEDDDALWAEQFARSADKLDRLAAEVRAEHEAGLTEPLDLGKDFDLDEEAR